MCFVDEKHHVMKLIDFGFSKDTANEARNYTIAGTLDYMGMCERRVRGEREERMQTGI